MSLNSFNRTLIITEIIIINLWRNSDRSVSTMSDIFGFSCKIARLQLTKSLFPNYHTWETFLTVSPDAPVRSSELAARLGRLPITPSSSASRGEAPPPPPPPPPLTTTLLLLLPPEAEESSKPSRALRLGLGGMAGGTLHEGKEFRKKTHAFCHICTSVWQTHLFPDGLRCNVP